MNKVKIFNLVREEFNEELAIAVIVFNTVHLDVIAKDEGDGEAEDNCR